MSFKTFKEIFDDCFDSSSINEERKEFNMEYINKTVKPSTGNIMLYLFKLAYLLPKEANQQDKQHWKSELNGTLAKALGNFGGVKSPALILSALNEEKESGNKAIKKELRTKYSSMMSEKEYTPQIGDDIANKFFPLISNWIFDIGKNVSRKDGSFSAEIRNFIDKLFP